MRGPSLLSVAAVVAAALAACSGDDAAPASSPEPVLAGVSRWGIQLQGFERPDAVLALASAPVDLLVIDRHSTGRGCEDFPQASAVERIRAGKGGGGKLVLAYVNVGQAEDYRTYWAPGWKAPGDGRAGAPSFLLALDPDGWPGNFPVAYWDPRWRPILFGAPDSLVTGAIADGFDGAMLDWVAGWKDPHVAAAADRAGIEPGRAMADLVRDLSIDARRRRPGFAVLLLNAADLVLEFPDLAEHIDGVVQESVTYSGAATDDWDDPKNADVRIPREGDWSTANHVRELTRVRELGLVVFTLDYATRPENASAAVDLARRHGFVPCVSRTPLDRLP